MADLVATISDIQKISGITTTLDNNFLPTSDELLTNYLDVSLENEYNSNELVLVKDIKIKIICTFVFVDYTYSEFASIHFTSTSSSNIPDEIPDCYIIEAYAPNWEFVGWSLTPGHNNNYQRISYQSIIDAFGVASIQTGEWTLEQYQKIFPNINLVGEIIFYPIYAPNEEYVDLGLDSETKWYALDLGSNGICNIGQQQPYVWGDSESKYSVDWDDYKYGGKKSLSKYCTDSSYGRVDNLTRLTTTDDPAYQINSDQLTPTYEQWLELCQCGWTDNISNFLGHQGFLVIGPNNNAIGFVSSDRALSLGNDDVYYWTSNIDTQYPSNAYYAFYSHIMYQSEPKTLNSYDRCQSFRIRPVKNDLFVDLGLSVKWSTCALGATSPWDYGDYYAWGETSPKDTFSLDNYFDPNYTEFSTDGVTELDLAHDAAYANLGSGWRMPTMNDFYELVSSTTCTWLQNSKGRFVMQFTSKINGKSIIIPQSGYKDEDGFHERNLRIMIPSSHIYPSDSSCPQILYGGEALGIALWYSDQMYRYCGFNIRPVYTN